MSGARRHTMSASARGELARARSRDYRRADRRTKSAILEEFVAATGVARKTAMGLLKEPPPERPRPRGRPGKRYGKDVASALELLWPLTDYACSKRLVPFLPSLIGMLESSGEWRFRDEVREKLLSISPATCDRLLWPARGSSRPKGRCLTKPGSLLKAQIPIRTHADWVEQEPGFLEADLVHHCGFTVVGEYLHTLTLTDVETGWTEIAGILDRSQTTVLTHVKSIRARLPFRMKGFDSDSGSEFINGILLGYCQGQGLIFTRSRPYQKNDCCRVEQKNWHVVRRNVGYDRFEGEEACRALNAFYRLLRLRLNFLQPSLKLQSKERVGARIRKRYDQAKTPCQRVLEHPCVPEERKKVLRDQLQAIEPMKLTRDILGLREELRRHAKE
jgi:hypothetical protein